MVQRRSLSNSFNQNMVRVLLKQVTWIEGKKEGGNAKKSKQLKDITAFNKIKQFKTKCA